MTLNEDKTISSVSEVSILGYCVSHGVMKPDPERLRPLKGLPPPTGEKSLQCVLGLFAYYAKWIPRFSNKISRLKSNELFRLDEERLKDFDILKQCIEHAAL